MDIKDDHLYSIKEGVKLTGILHRTLTRKASKLGAIKIDGRFLLSGHQIKELIKKQAKKQAYLNKRDSQPLVKVVNSQHKKTKIIAPKEDTEALKAQIKSLEERLQQFDKKSNERIEIFTEADYVIFEQRLKEWRLQDQQIKLLDEKKTHSDRLFKELDRKNIEQNYENRFLKRENGRLEADNEQKRGLIAELVEFTKRLGATLETQSKDLFTKTAMEAKKTDWSNKDKK
jgi:ribonuclease HI